MQSIVGGTPEDLANRAHTCELALDDVDDMIFRDHSFCFSGEFAFGPRSRCVEVVEERGGLFLKHVTKKLNYLVAGGLGSDEWKHGSFGTKIKKAVRYRRQGVPLLIVHEADWARHL